MAGKMLETDRAVVHKRKPKRIRQRKCFTLPIETMDGLEELMRLENLTSLSRAIDEAVSFRLANSNAVNVQLPPFVLKRLTKYFLKLGTLPGPGLASIASELVATLPKAK